MSRTSPRAFASAAFAFAVIALASQPAAAQKLVTSISTHRVLINSSFTGTEVVVFGAIEDVPGAAFGKYDIVVTVRGPGKTYVTRRKSEVFGLWVNTSSREFKNVPSFLAVMTNRPANEMGPPDLLRRNKIGLDNHVFPQQIGHDIADVSPDDPFRRSFLRVREADGAYSADPAGITFITPKLFRTTIAIPGTAITGTYEVETLLLLNGAVVAKQQTALEVVKTGFEAVVASEARHHGLFYGLVTIFLAILSGLIASLLFRR